VEDPIKASLALLKQQRSMIDTAIHALEGLAEKQPGPSIVKPFVKPVRTMSAQARANMSKGQKARWTTKKKAA